MVLAFTTTWLPYFIVSWQNISLTSWSSFVFCFFYTSVILNPIIYGMRSMKFNGKTGSAVLRSVFKRARDRARALSMPLRGGDQAVIVGQEETTRSYYDIEGVEDMATNY